MPFRHFTILLASLLILTSSPPAKADTSLSFAGLRTDVFGGWAWGKTTQGEYLDGSQSGEAENAGVGLILRKEFSPSFQATGQFELEQHPGETEAVIDYLFVDWHPREEVSLRVGRTKQPFGIYSEFFAIGTDRPFFDLPQGVYGPAEIVAESFDGLTYSGRHDLSTGELRWDIYAGRISFATTEPWEDLRAEELPGTVPLDVQEEKIHRDKTVGFRVEWQSNSNLTLGMSAYRGEDRHTGDEEFGSAIGFGAHAMWENDTWLFRAEAVHFEEKGNLDVDAAYVEAARYFGPHWQAALRWDRSNTSLEEVDLESFGAATLGEHRDLALGVNYWLSSKLVFKLSHHWVEGGRFLSGEDTLAGEEIELWRFGVQFAY